jgi:hypothetical protein
METPFDVHDTRGTKRRTRFEIEAEIRAWDEKIENAIKKAISEYSGDEYVKSVTLYEDAGILHGNWEVIRRGLEKALKRLKYTKILNENAKDGRWKLDGQWTYVYRKEGQPKIGISELKQYFG